MDTWSIMGGWTALIPVFLIFPVGFGLHFLQEGRAQAMPELQVFGVYGLQATGAVFGSFYLWNLVCAPYRIARDKLSDLESKIGIGKPIVRPDLTLKGAIDYLRASEEYNLYSLDEICIALTDLCASGQIKIWGRDANVKVYGMPIDATDEQRMEAKAKLVRDTYSTDNKRTSPLHELSNDENFKNQIISYRQKDIDLMSGDYNGALVNRFVGMASSSYDLHFSKVELVKVLNRELD